MSPKLPPKNRRVLGEKSHLRGRTRVHGKPQYPGPDKVVSGQRYYNPGTGRWVNRDPIEEWGGINLYGFARNSSPNCVDTDGREILLLFEETVIPRPIIEIPFEQYANKPMPFEGAGKGFDGPEGSVIPYSPTVPVPVTGPQHSPLPQTSTERVSWEVDDKVEPGDYLYRNMSGWLSPDIGEAATKLGVRPGVDVELNNGIVSTMDSRGNVQGLSTSPRPDAGAPFRIPKDFGGSSNKSTWAIKRSDIIDSDLLIHDDNPSHTTIAPSHCIKYEDYKRALETTHPRWKKVKPIKIRFAPITGGPMA